MHFSQTYSQPATQPCREAGGETSSNAAIAGLNIPSIPGFTKEQCIGLHGLITAFQIAMDRAFDQSLDRFTAKMDRAFDQAFERHFNPPQQPSLNPTPISTPLTSPAKKKRNQKTREQYRKKAQAQRVTMQVQEMEHSDVRISVEKEPGKHVVLYRKAPWDCVATSPQHAVISCVEMALFDGMITVLNGAICMLRMGVG